MKTFTTFSKNLCISVVTQKEQTCLFEMILSSSSKKSAKYISLIWEEYEFWKKSNVLIWKRDGSEKLPIQFIVDSGKNENLFSFLIFDWHNPDRHQANKEKKYFLELKNKQLIETSDESLFQKLYKIIENGDVYHEVCLRIVYEYLAEMDARVKEEKRNKADKNDSKQEKDYHEDLKKLVSIEYVLKMNNKEYQAKILEILVTYFNILDENFANEGNQKNIFLATETAKNDISFFNLAFYLIKREHNSFEESFDRYIKSTKKNFGHYYETILKPAARLLLKIAQTQRMLQVQTFIFHHCSYVELNSSPLTNFQEFYKFNNKNIFPLNPKELEILVSFTLFLIGVEKNLKIFLWRWKWRTLSKV